MCPAHEIFHKYFKVLQKNAWEQNLPKICSRGSILLFQGCYRLRIFKPDNFGHLNHTHQERTYRKSSIYHSVRIKSGSRFSIYLLTDKNCPLQLVTYLYWMYCLVVWNCSFVFKVTRWFQFSIQPGHPEHFECCPFCMPAHAFFTLSNS